MTLSMLRSLIILGLCATAFAWDLIPRQANTSSPSDAPQCCWIVAYREPVDGKAVFPNYWYSKTYEQVIATVITTFVVSGTRTFAANSTTSNIPRSEVFTSFGNFYPFENGRFVTIPGIPTDLIDSQDEPNYRGTIVAPVTEPPLTSGTL